MYKEITENEYTVDQISVKVSTDIFMGKLIDLS